MSLVLDYIDGLAIGLVSIAMGQAWDRFVIWRGWRGWHIDDDIQDAY